MVSAAMAIQDQNGVLSTGTGISLKVGSHSGDVVQLKEQFPSGNDCALKVRKPYTITKQRERWTEEEHNKFIEALKLYGRAWRRIEEHVGTKTAVQIRSHAQKFFSKVVRQSSNADVSSEKPIEIPPPRPKRKPAHPYPRKLVAPLKTGTSVAEQPTRSTSPNSYASDQENQSPTSVLSAIGSEFLRTTDSTTPNGSLSPVSSADGVDHDGFLVSEPNSFPEETVSLPELNLLPSSSPDEQVPMESELSPQENAFIEESSAEVASTRSLKLFGKTVLVSDSITPNSALCESPPSDMNDGRHGCTLPWNLMPMEFSNMSMEEKWNPPSGAPAAFYYMPFPNQNPNPADGVSGPALPWWAFYGGMPFASFPLQNPAPTDAHPSSIGGETRDGEAEKEGSWTCSNTGTVNAGREGDKNWEVETQSRLVSSDKEENEQQSRLPGKPSENLSFSKQRTALDKCLKGFVPYKRFLDERHTQSSSITSADREEQRIRLCL